MSQLDLIILGQHTPNWPYGLSWRCPANPSAINQFIDNNIPHTQADAWLFWAFENPPVESVLAAILAQPGDIWHAGLKLGLGGLPRMIDFIWPLWMLNCDPAVDREATSWRMSFRACLIRTEVLRQLGGPLQHFESLEGAALEYGYRCIKAGVQMRHVPSLIVDESVPPVSIPLADELRFIDCHASMKWKLWALQRAAFCGMAPLWKLLGTWNKIRDDRYVRLAIQFKRPPINDVSIPNSVRVSVLIPTVDRYPYLRTLLEQLRQQTVAPHEIIVIDQTPIDERDVQFAVDFADLPLRVFVMDEPGQCRSRNLGLQNAQGDYILFLDDDVEIPPDFIETHLRNLYQYGVDVSSGTVFEPDDPTGTGYQDRLRVSDVFPTNNTLMHKTALLRSGLFDLAYDHRARADGDLGMRIYLSGSRMLLDETRPILHHRAPRGGLRTHKARVVTRSSSRKSLTQRHLMTASDFYLGYRYFRPHQVQEMRLISAFATLFAAGSAWRRAFRMVRSLFQLHDTRTRLRQAEAQAQAMLRTFPQIPVLASEEKNSSD